MKIGRNDPCPCGSRNRDKSRKKYKKCCIGRTPICSAKKAQELSQLTLQSEKEEHARFLKAHNQGICYGCSLPYDEYDESKLPCPHWLLRPKGIKKDKVIAPFLKHGFDRVVIFLRWLANTEAFASQINDLKDENDKNIIFEITIKYKNFKWAFTCKQGDLIGHKNSKFGRDPHFHFQMHINDLPFINYNDYHINFTKEDLFNLDIKQNKIPGVRWCEHYGVGMNDLANLAIDTDLRGLENPSKETISQFRLDTFMASKTGESLSYDQMDSIIKLPEESKRTGIPIAKLARRIKDLSVITSLEPSSSVPEQAVRPSRKKSKK